MWGQPWSFLQPTTEINGSLIAYHHKMDKRWWRAQVRVCIVEAMLSSLVLFLEVTKFNLRFYCSICSGGTLFDEIADRVHVWFTERCSPCRFWKRSSDFGGQKFFQGMAGLLDSSNQLNPIFEVDTFLMRSTQIC